MKVAKVDLKNRDERVADTEIHVLCDVKNTLLGGKGAARVFGPQKGAGPEQVSLLGKGLDHLARVAGQDGLRKACMPGAGAAGGLAWGMSTFLNADLLSGAEEIIRLTGLAGKCAQADIVITGEGALDAQTFEGKAPFALAEAARKTGARLVGVGGTADDAARHSGLFDIVLSLSEEVGGEEALARPEKAMEQAVFNHARDIIGLWTG